MKVTILKHRILLSYIAINLLIFLIPVTFSIFIPEKESVNTFSYQKDKPDEKAITVSVLDNNTKKITSTNLEEYLKGVVAAEMPASYEEEALKAQAVAARSYIMSKLNIQNPAHPEAAVCNNPAHCKGYLSTEDANAKWGTSWKDTFYPKIESAVEYTKGEYLSYKGEVAEAFFFALSNGKTESAEDVWGTKVPYLKSTLSSGDKESPDFYSTTDFSVSEFNNRLKNLFSGFSPEEKIRIGKITYTNGDRVKTIKINGTEFKGTDIRGAFSLNSADFAITQSSDKVIFEVKGKGHGVGMSQYGANSLAKKGHTYEEILKHYFSGVEIINK